MAKGEISGGIKVSFDNLLIFLTSDLLIFLTSDIHFYVLRSVNSIG